MVRVRDWLGPRLAELGEAAEVERWATREDVISEPAISAALEHLRRRYGVVENRAGVRLLTGWLAGPPASVVTALAVHDRVGVDLAGSRGVQLGLASEGYVVALRIDTPRVGVLPGHPWAGSADVATVGTPSQLGELVVAGIAAWCRPVVAALDPACGGRGPLWAQVADALGWVPDLLAAGEPGSQPLTAIERVEGLLVAPSAPWRRAPRLWTADAGGRAIPVCHRSSCCLFYRSQEPEEPFEPAVDADYAARFGDDSPEYCGTCRLRDAADVEARAVYWALRAAAPSSVQ